MLLSGAAAPTAVLSAALPSALASTGVPFIEKPYLQLGDAPHLADPETIEIVWQADDQEKDWRVKYRQTSSAPWKSAEAPQARRIAVVSIAPYRLYRSKISGLQPGAVFDYRVLLAGKEVFHATGRARKSFAQPYRFALFGDCGEDSPGQRGVAYQVSLLHPDFVFIPGDIVYKRGRVSEYRVKFFPIYNSDAASPTAGAPLMRSVLFLSVAGNRDSQHRDPSESPDGMAYFPNWLQPLNGPDAAIFHDLEGALANRKTFLASAGKLFPQMANFSFDYGNSHWTVLDCNPYVNWNDPALRQSVANGLSSAADAQCRFIAFHHPGFHSSNKYAEQQRMRVLSPVFEAGKVDVVFSGHVHNYERSYPMRFVPQPVDLTQTKAAPASGASIGTSMALRRRKPTA